MCSVNCIARNIFLISAIAVGIQAQSWVTVNTGPKPEGQDGDGGSRREAIMEH
ncbi:MAG: hypothetical protein GF350_09965 [Chitinivibrionales bacterium]|nr:hypothetical protein [Chitinivibrionales bacterium]